jgi:hypothetical protein
LHDCAMSTLEGGEGGVVGMQALMAAWVHACLLAAVVQQVGVCWLILQQLHVLGSFPASATCVSLAALPHMSAEFAVPQRRVCC